MPNSVLETRHQRRFVLDVRGLAIVEDGDAVDGVRGHLPHESHHVVSDSGKGQRHGGPGRAVPMHGPPLGMPLPEATTVEGLPGRRPVEGAPAQPVVGVDLETHLVGGVDGHLERIDPLLHVLAPALDQQAVADPDEILQRKMFPCPHPSDFGEVVADVPVDPVPVDSPEVGVAVGFQVRPDELGRGRFRPSPGHGPGVVVAEEPAGVGPRPILLQGCHLFRIQRHQFDVGDPRLFADVAVLLVRRDDPLARLTQDEVLSGQVGGLEVDVLNSRPPDGVILGNPRSQALRRRQEERRKSRVATQPGPHVHVLVGPPGGIEHADVDVVDARRVQTQSQVGRLGLLSRKDQGPLEVLGLIVDEPPGETFLLAGQGRFRLCPAEIGEVDGSSGPVEDGEPAVLPGFDRSRLSTARE